MLPFIISIGIAAGLFFGLLSVAAARKLYQYLICKKQPLTGIINSPPPVEDHLELKQKSTDAAVAWLFCWPKAQTARQYTNNNVTVLDDVEDVELGLRVKSFVEEGGGGIEAELMRLHNLCGPPRFLFTIKEETLEDLASEEAADSKPMRSTRLVDLMRAVDDVDFHLSPIASPVKKKPRSPTILSNKGFVNNPLFECSAEAELNRLMSSPPPTFKFLRDAEEKLQRKLEAERQNNTVASF